MCNIWQVPCYIHAGCTVIQNKLTIDLKLEQTKFKVTKFIHGYYSFLPR